MSSQLIKNITAIFVFAARVMNLSVFTEARIVVNFYLRINSKNMSWQDYFVYDNVNECYRYKNKNVITLPDNLPMPPINNFGYLFSGCKYLQDISVLANWNVSNVTNMESMFYGDKVLQDITALSKWDVSNVNDMNAMFYCCDKLQDISALSNWNVSNVTNTRYMFAQCWRIQDISALANWDISNVTDTKDMFYGCCREVNIAPLLGKHDNHGQTIIGESALMFRWEIDKLKSHIAHLEEKITALTEMIEQKKI